MTVRVYRSTDASAPTLTGQVGSLTSLLDAVLVNGYGSKTAAGWTINQTTTNKRGYLQNLTGSNNASGMLLYVDDTGPGAGAAREARVCGFETMSAIAPTGTGQFPLAGQPGIITGGFLVIRKSNTADATARPWTIVANGQSIYIFIENGDTTTPVATVGFFFGDFKSYKTSDQYAVAIIGRFAENVATMGSEAFSLINYNTTGNVNNLAMSYPGHFIARRHTGVGGSVRFGKPTDASKISTALAGGWQGEASATITFTSISMGRYNTAFPWQSPNPVDGAIWLSPVYVCHEGALRGYLPGLWNPLHDRPLAHNDSITVAGGNLNGKTLVAQAVNCIITGNNDQGLCFIETSDTWS